MSVAVPFGSMPVLTSARLALEIMPKQYAPQRLLKLTKVMLKEIAATVAQRRLTSAPNKRLSGVFIQTIPVAVIGNLKSATTENRVSIAALFFTYEGETNTNLELSTNRFV